MRTQHSMAQEDMTTFSCTRSLHSANRTQRMRQQELSAMEQGTRCASFQQNQDLQIAVQENPRRAPDAENQAVAESSARCERTSTKEVRAAQLKKDSTVEQRDDKFFSESHTKLNQHSSIEEPIC